MLFSLRSHQDALLKAGLVLHVSSGHPIAPYGLDKSGLSLIRTPKQGAQHVMIARRADRAPTGDLLVVLACAMGVGPLIMYGLSAVSTVVIDDLRISTTQFGWLATACFIAATLSSVGLGRISDRADGRTLILIIFGGAAIALTVAGLSTDYLWLLVAVSVSGVAQAMSNPATNRLVSIHVEEGKRSTWIGIKQSGVQGSQFIAGLAFPAMAILVGWRETSGIAAVAVFIMLAISWNIVPAGASLSKRGGGRSAGAPDRPSVPVESGGDNCTTGAENLPIFAVYAFLSGAALQATNVYLPLFSQRELGFSLLLGGMTVAIAGGLGVASRIAWGRIIAKRGDNLALLLALGLGSALGSSLLLASGILHWSVLLWFGVVLHGVMALAINVVLMVAVMRDASAQNVGAASGVVALGMYLGFALGPLAMGLVLETKHEFFVGWAGTVATYLACVLLTVITILRRR